MINREKEEGVMDLEEDGQLQSGIKIFSVEREWRK
jgi:hypothetical protein